MADSYISILDSDNLPKKVLTDLTGDVHTQQAQLIAANEATLAAIQAAVEALQTAVEAFTSANRVQADVAGTVTANTGLSQPLTDTQLRATAVPVNIGATDSAALAAIQVATEASQTVAEGVSREEITTLNGGAVDAQQVQRMTPAIITANGTAVDVDADAPMPVSGTVSVDSAPAIDINSLPSLPTLGDGELGTVKIGAGADPMAAIGGDAANGLDVDVTRLPEIPAGSNSIGTVGLDSGVNAIGTVGVDSLPVDGTTGANGSVVLRGYNYNTDSYQELPFGTGATSDPVLPVVVIGGNLGSMPTFDITGDIYENNIQAILYVKRVSLSASSSGDNTIVAAVTDKKIRVLSLTLSASAAVNVKFQSGAGGTDLTGLYYLAANGGVVLPHNQHGWFETAASALLNLNLSAANTVGGCLTYIEV